MQAAAVPFAAFGTRVMARMIDELVLLMVAMPIIYIFGTEDGVASPGVFLGLVVNLLYEGYLPTSSWQGTLGKKLLHLKIETLQGGRIGSMTSLRRLLLPLAANVVLQLATPEDGQIHDPAVGVIVILSVLTIVACYLWVLIQPQRRGLHDLIAGTCVRQYGPG